MKEFDVYVPLTHNDGSPVEDRMIEAVGKRLLEFFDGMTYFPQENKGFWKMGDVLFRDSIVIFRVLSDRPRSARKFLKKLKEHLKRTLDQEEILIVEKHARIL